MRRALRFLVRVPQYLILGVFRTWQLLVSPLYGQTCRFYPSCSSYGVESVRLHGAVRGLILTAWRILRCNPWNAGGVDLVPPAGEFGRPFRRPSRRQCTEHDLNPHAEVTVTGDDDVQVAVGACPDELAPVPRRVA